MATTQEILSAVSNIQPSAQGALPVMPNNGNPSGAYNMPSATSQQANAEKQGQPAEDPRFAWVKPSPAMNRINNYLKQRATLFDQPPPQMTNNYNPAVSEGQFVDVMLDDAGLPMYEPVLPQRGR